MLISIFMMLPLLVFGTWLYFRFTPRRAGAGDWAYDLLVFSVAVGGSLLASHYSLAQAPTDAGPIWRPVLMVLAVYHVFAVVLPVGAWLRRRRVTDGS